MIQAYIKSTMKKQATTKNIEISFITLIDPGLVWTVHQADQELHLVTYMQLHIELH